MIDLKPELSASYPVGNTDPLSASYAIGIGWYVTEGRKRDIIEAGGPTKILVVEDQFRIGVFLKQALLDRSYGVALAPSCGEAHDALFQATPHPTISRLWFPDLH